MKTREDLIKESDHHVGWAPGMKGIVWMLRLILEVLIDIRDQKKEQA